MVRRPSSAGFGVGSVMNYLRAPAKEPSQSSDRISRCQQSAERANNQAFASELDRRLFRFCR